MSKNFYHSARRRFFFFFDQKPWPKDEVWLVEQVILLPPAVGTTPVLVVWHDYYSLRRKREDLDANSSLVYKWCTLASPSTRCRPPVVVARLLQKLPICTPLWCPIPEVFPGYFHSFGLEDSYFSSKSSLSLSPRRWNDGAATRSGAGLLMGVPYLRLQMKIGVPRIIDSDGQMDFGVPGLWDEVLRIIDNNASPTSRTRYH